MKILIIGVLGALSVFTAWGNAKSECPDLSGTYFCGGGIIVVTTNNTDDAITFSLKKEGDGLSRQSSKPEWSVFHNFFKHGVPLNYVVDGNKHEISGISYIGFCEEDKLKIVFLSDDPQDDEFPRVVEFSTKEYTANKPNSDEPVIHKTLSVMERTDVSAHGGNIEQVEEKSVEVDGNPIGKLITKASAPFKNTYNFACDGHP